MKIWTNIFKVVIFIIGIIVVVFNVLLYNFSEKQKIEMDNIKSQQEEESEFNNNKFKYEQDQIERIGKDLEDAEQQIKAQNDALDNQKDAFLQEVEKRQEVENADKSVQTSLIDIKAEADAIKQDMKSWQKDYVGVLAELEKKMDDSQDEIKGVKDDLDSFEKATHPADNTLTNSFTP